MTKIQLSPLLCITLLLCSYIVAKDTIDERTSTTLSYLPQQLKKCISTIYENNENDIQNKYSDAYKLYRSMQKDEKLAYRETVREGIEEALLILDESNDELTDKQRNEIEGYLENYLEELDSNAVFLPIKSDNESYIALPQTKKIKRFIPLNWSETQGVFVDSNFLDIICLNNQLSSSQNVHLSGINEFSNTIPKRHKLSKKCKRGKRGKRGKKGKRGKRGHTGATGATGATGESDPEIILNPNMLTSPLATSPDRIFNSTYGSGPTGVYTPVINAWMMHQSSESQNPISAQFSIPFNIRFDLPTRADFHFLVNKNNIPSGSARIELNATYMTPGGEIGMNPPASGFTQTLESSDFTIVEPVGDDNLIYAATSIMLDTSLMQGADWIYFSCIRIAPEVGPEYAGDIYLSVISFIYNEPLP